MAAGTVSAGNREANSLAGSGKNRSPFRVFMNLLCFFVLAGALWAVATPLMAYPDEPSHTIRAAAVVRGQILVEPGQSFGNGIHVRVPAFIANLETQTCFAFQLDKTADCAPTIPSNDNYDAVAVTTAGLYNPMYYWIVGLPSLFLSGAPALYAMRILSAVLSAAFYAAGYAALLQLRRPKWPVVAASIATTPMTLYLASGINPNALEIAATMAAFCSLLLVLDNTRTLSAVKPAILTVGIATATLANTRSISLLWLACAVAVACMFYRGRDFAALFRSRRVLVTIAVAAVGVVAGLIWMHVAALAPVSSGIAPEGIANAAPNVAPYQAFLTMLDRSFDFINQYIGVMGWLDSVVPQAVLSFWSMLFFLAILLPLVTRPRKLSYGLLLALALLAVVPALVQGSLVTSVGFIWQGRYSMPLLIVVLISAGMAWRCHGFSTAARSRTVARVVIIAGAAAHIYAFTYILRRYVVGIINIGTWQTMITHPSWQPPLGWFVLTVLYAVVILVAAQALYGYLFPGQILIEWFRFRVRRLQRVNRTS